ncbi:sensor histidine kinase [Roseixanthobacter pseudopolyaromaticivorans]|uniref:sensor histidine kinase n=1 Tax=Xanthobacteraceae TaxID=335928 RepID=UPI003728225D
MERPFGSGARPALAPSGAGMERGGFREAQGISTGPVPQPDSPLRIAHVEARQAAGRLLAATVAALGLAGLAVLFHPASLYAGLCAVAVAYAALHARRLYRALDAGERAATAQAQEGARAERAVADARAENAAKSRFLAEMSHELRTPLNAVLGFSEMMAQEVLGRHAVPTYGDYARDIHASGRHLLALADDILDVARIETGHRTLLETAVSLEALAQDCTHMMRLAANAKAIRLSCLAPPPVPRLWADERALRQITLNLLANAVKFTPVGGAVTLHAGLTDTGTPFFAVEDTGPGIGEAELPFALAASHHESRLDLTTGRGAGLGLAIARGLAALHGATLTLEKRPSGGTRAQVTFPATRTLPAAEEDHADAGAARQPRFAPAAE